MSQANLAVFERSDLRST